MNLSMKRSLFLISSILLIGLVACGTPAPTNPDGGGTTFDLAGGNNTDATLCKGPGCIGAPCTGDLDCTEGANGAAVCWTGTLLNNPKLVTTPDGYCTRECASDADCGTAKCVTLPGTTKHYCMARCSGASTCRHPGYSCAFDGPVGGICFPNGNFNCDPTVGDGTCEAGSARYLGGCIRAAYENTGGGVCHLQCQVGQMTCAPDERFGTTNAPPQECIFLDTTVDSKGNPAATGDKFRGNVCFQQPSVPLGPQQPCTYWTDCQDGFQCDRYASSQATAVCRQLCALGNGVQSTPLGLQVPTGAKPATGACATPGEACANSLRAGVQDGNAGLCQPPKM
jgi:hypothetical protein